MSSEDWPQWRGPQRTGVASWVPPRSWPDALVKRWQVSVGEGHSSPAVLGDLVYQFSREGEDEIVRALRLADGETRWRASYPAPYQMNPSATAHGRGPKSSPLVVDGKVFVLGIDGMLSCYDAEDGGLVWQHDFKNLYPATSPLYGHATSPLLAQGKLITHIGGPGQGSICALEPETGLMIWHHDGDGPGYASPIVVRLERTRQIVTQTDAHIVGIALSEGSSLWKIPFKTPYDQNIQTPILHGNRLIFSGLGQRTISVSVAGNETRERWKKSVTFYMSTPVLVGDRLIGFSDKKSGHFVALEAGNGKTIWEGPPRQGDNAAIVAAGDWVLALTDSAELFVLRADADRFDPVRRYSVADSPTWAHPVPTVKGILVKDKTTLALWGFA